MSPDDAAVALDQHLRPFPWYVSVGVGRTKEGPLLFVYVRSSRHRELRSIESGWLGYPVAVRTTGAIRPLAAVSFC
jgi:hypothetical protein